MLRLQCGWGWCVRIKRDQTLFRGIFGVGLVAAEVGEHVDEGGMGSDGAGADEIDAAARGDGSGFAVEVVEHFDVVAQEADRGRDDGLDAIAIAFEDEGVDVGLRPGDGWIRGPALVSKIECLSTEFSGYQRGGAAKLPGVG